jgi:polysaccharide biosynthesis protein PslF
MFEPGYSGPAHGPRIEVVKSLGPWLPDRRTRMASSMSERNRDSHGGVAEKDFLGDSLPTTPVAERYEPAGVNQPHRIGRAASGSDTARLQHDRHGGQGIALLGTYPPTQCGIATFTHSLHKALAAAEGNGPHVVRIAQAQSEPGGSEVMAELHPDDPQSVHAVAQMVSSYRAVILQHEFGIFGSSDGKSVLDLVDQITVPLLVTLHTVVPNPLEPHRKIIRGLGSRAERLIVMSDTAAEFLHRSYGIDPERVEVIPHGSQPVETRQRPRERASGQFQDPSLLSWGLVGPGKGLEWAILATGILKNRYPGVRLVIAGQTHPKVFAQEGDTYLECLRGIVERTGLQDNVVFINRYLPRETLEQLIEDCSLVVLPYDSKDQTSSGVLVEAIAAGVPVVATDFPQAVEMSEHGAASVVPHHDPNQLAVAIGHLIENPTAVRRMLRAQARVSKASDWDEVAKQYLRIVREVTGSASSFGTGAFALDGKH